MKMYTNKELWGLSRGYSQKNGFVAYIIFLFAIVLACGIIALNLVLPFLFYILVPFAIIPAFFAAQAAIILLRDEPQLTLGGFFKCFFAYYGEHFRSTFRVLKSLLFSLIFYGSILITSLIAVFISFYFTNFHGFADLFNSLSTTSITSIDELNALLDKYSYAINLFGLFTSFPALTTFTFVFIYLCSKNSVSIFYRLSNYKLTGRFISEMHTAVMKNHKKTFLKYYWSLNWPLYVLLISGFALGGYVGYLYQLSFNSLYTFGLMVAIFVAYFIYGPTYLANKESISIALKDAYEEEANKLASMLATSMEDLLNKIKRLEEQQEKQQDNEEE